MTCDDASRALHALSAEARKVSGTEPSAKAEGEKTPDLEIHLSACDECRALGDDLAQLSRAFERARTEWAPRAGFRVRLPIAPWRKLAIAAGLLVLPLAGWAMATVRAAPRPDHDVGFLLRSGPRETPASDREVLTTMFLPESQP